MWTLPDDVRAVEDDPARLWTVNAGQDVEDRCLTGPVGADDGEQFTPADGEADTIDGLNALEREPNIVDGQDWLLGHGMPSVFGRF
jgi:hypothetical protein